MSAIEATAFRTVFADLNTRDEDGRYSILRERSGPWRAGMSFRVEDDEGTRYPAVVDEVTDFLIYFKLTPQGERQVGSR